MLRDLYAAYVHMSGVKFYREVLVPGCNRFARWGQEHDLDVLPDVFETLGENYQEMSLVYEAAANYIREFGILAWHIERFRLIRDIIVGKVEGDSISVASYIQDAVNLRKIGEDYYELHGGSSNIYNRRH